MPKPSSAPPCTPFTRGLRGEAQKETEIGPVPEGWGGLDWEVQTGDRDSEA